MTGYGRAQWAEGSEEIDVEMRSVNNRFLKLTLHLPEGLSPYQLRLEKLLRTHLSRGTLNLSVRCRSRGTAATGWIDAESLRSYQGRLQQLGDELATPAVRALSELLDLPGVVTEVPPAPLSEEVFTRVAATVERALVDLMATREAEGAHLMAALQERQVIIADAVDNIRERTRATPGEIQQRLTQRVSTLLGDIEAGNLAAGDLAREVALLADRADVTEELDRLRAHLHRFGTVLEGARARGETCGRELEFIAQELLREANTIGAKSVDHEVTHLVVAIKSEVEKLKEQLQNVE